MIWKNSNQDGVVIEATGFEIKLVEFKFLPSLHKLCDFRQVI